MTEFVRSMGICSEADYDSKMYIEFLSFEFYESSRLLIGLHLADSL